MKKINKIFIAICSSLILTSGLFAQPWTVNPSDYEFSMNVTGKVYISDAVIDQQSCFIGAFVDDICVGVASPVELEGEFQLFYLTIFSNTISGELVEFKFFDNAETEHTIANNVRFVSDSYIGSLENPFLWMDVEAYSSTDFLSFSFQEQTSAAIINPIAKTIDIEVAFGTGLSSLIANFEIAPGASAFVADVEQISTVTTNNYSTSIQYDVVGVDANTTIWTVSVTVDNSSVDINYSNLLTIYPNPANDFVLIESKDCLSGEIKVFDLSGKMVYETCNFDNKSNQLRIDVSHFEKGIYLLAMIDGNLVRQVCKISVN